MHAGPTYLRGTGPYEWYVFPLEGISLASSCFVGFLRHCRGNQQVREQGTRQPCDLLLSTERHFLWPPLHSAGGMAASNGLCRECAREDVIGRPRVLSRRSHDPSIPLVEQTNSDRGTGFRFYAPLRTCQPRSPAYRVFFRRFLRNRTS